MRPTSVTQSAAGPSAWVPVDYLAIAFGIGFGCSVSSGASLTYTVQHTFDDLGPGSPGTTPTTGFHYPTGGISQTTTTITVTDANHGLSVGDFVQLQGCGSGMDGAYTVASVTNANVYTLTSAVSQSATASSAGFVCGARVYNHPVVVGATARQDGNYAFPIRAMRVNVTAWTSGSVSLTVLQGVGAAG